MISMPIGHFYYIQVENDNLHPFQHYRNSNDRIYLSRDNYLMMIEDKYSHRNNDR